MVPLAACALLAACATTTVEVLPAPQRPVCDRTATALVLWAPQWRADQKDVADREAAAAVGLADFLATSGCFARQASRRVADLDAAAAQAPVTTAGDPVDRVVTVGVRELGPVVRFLSSAALVEGGTEVVLEVTARTTSGMAPARRFTTRWRHGGPGVVKGVASLSADMRAALTSALQPDAGAR